MEKLNICITRDTKVPSFAHLTDAGMDFCLPKNLKFEDINVYSLERMVDFWPNIRCTEDKDSNIETLTIYPKESIIIPTGIFMKVPKGYAMIFFNKSGVASKKSLILGACVVDEGYEGEIMINLHNIGKDKIILNAGDKLAQGVLLQVGHFEINVVNSVNELYRDSNSERGEGGFGSTGR